MPAKKPVKQAVKVAKPARKTSPRKKPAAKKAAKPAAPVIVRKKSKAGDVADSMKSAAIRLGLPLSHVKLAKQMGCRAFVGSGSRVNLPSLRRYVATEAFRQAAADLDSEGQWDKRLKKAKALSAEIDLEIRKGRYWESQAVIRYWAADRVVVQSELAKFLESELPPLAEGKAAQEIQSIARAFRVRLIESLERRTAEMVGEVSRQSVTGDDEEDED